MRTLAVPAVLALALVACSTDVIDIHAESTSGAGGHASVSGAGGNASPSGAGGHGTQGAGGGSTTTGAGGSGAGSCCNEPVHVAGNVKTLTADTDAGQLVSGGVAGQALVVQGPFVLTDVHVDGGLSISQVDGSSCALNVPRRVVVLGTGNVSDAHGLRVFVPSGSSLCNDSGNPGSFSGFRPY